MEKVMQLREKNAKLVSDLREIMEKPERDGRAWSAEDEQAYTRCYEEVDQIGGNIDRLERQERIEIDMDAPDSDPLLPDEDRDTPEANTSGDRYFEKWLRRDHMTSEDQSAMEQRALQIDVDTAGGFIATPQKFVKDLIKAVDDRVWLRKLATVHSIPKAESLGAPSLDNDPADPTWVGELAIGTEDTTMDFGKRQLFPHPLAQFIKVSRTLLRKAAIGPEAIVRQRLAYKMSIVQENAFLNGTGAMQPLGVFTASSNGISTGRDVSTDNTTTAIAADNLIEVKYNIKENYWPKLNWIFHRTAVKNIHKLKDGEGNYLLQPNLQDGPAQVILDVPLRMSEFAPSTFTTGLYVGILGDFSMYWIADALSMSVQRLDELYAAANQVGFISRTETDGMPVLEEAFTRVKLA